MSDNRQDSHDRVPATWRPIAWNGVQFSVPPDWEAAKIGPRYLMMETENGPILELKWQPVKGRFSHHRQLRRLSSLFAKPLRKSIKTQAVPARWQSALADFEAIGFRWDGESVHGSGVILYCKQCRTATLIQFYDNGRQAGRLHACRVLESFQDHPVGGETRWALYDISARIPNVFELQSFQFRAGDFRLRFSGGKQRLALHRWGPASLLLKDEGLKTFVSSRPFVRNAGQEFLMTEGSDTCEGVISPNRIGLKRLRALLSGAPAYRRFRVWHRTDANRILGVRLDSSRPFDSGLLNDICMKYETICE